jgi:hypothetical protein
VFSAIVIIGGKFEVRRRTPDRLAIARGDTDSSNNDASLRPR